MAAVVEKSTEFAVAEFQQGHDQDRNLQLLFERFYAQVCRFFQRKGFPLEDCQELTQEVFFSVYKGLLELRQAEQFQSWLFTEWRRSTKAPALRRRNSALRWRDPLAGRRLAAGPLQQLFHPRASVLSE